MTITVSGSTVTFSDSSSQNTAFTGSATNLAGGAAGEIPFQTGSGTTSFTSAGSSGQVLTSAGTGTPTWSTPSAGAMTLISTINPNNTSTQLTFTGLSGYDKYLLVYENIQVTSSGGDLRMVLGTGSSPTYITSGYYGWDLYYASSSPTGVILSNYSNLFLVGGYYNGAITGSSGISGYAILQGMNNSTDTSIQLRQVFASYGGGNPMQVDNFDVFIQGNSTPKTAIKIYSSANLVSGKVSLYGISS